MRFGMFPAGLLAAIFLASLPGTARAQAPLDEGTWMLTGSAGLALDSDADPSLVISGAAAYVLTPQLAVEGELGHVVDTVPGDANVDASLTTVHGSVLYFFDTSYKLTPYIAGGLGVGKFTTTVKSPPEDESSTEVGFNLGAGVTYPLGSGVSFRGDFRYFKHIDQVPSVWRFSGGISVRVGS